MTVKVIIFDFDGTIADTLEALWCITNRLATQFGYQQISQEELAQIRNLTSQQIIKHSGISIFKFPLLIGKIKAELSNDITKIKLISEIELALIQLKNKGNRLWILSSNSQENILEFLKKNNLQDVFELVYTGATIFGKSKILKKLIKQEKIKPEECIYVGDETRDIEAARRSNIRAIAVSWGFNSKEVLAAQNPDFLLQHPSELVSLIKNLHQTEVSN